MKITDVRVFTVEGHAKGPLALWQGLRPGAQPQKPSPHRETFIELRTDDGATGIQNVYYGVERDVKEAGSLLIGEDPLRTEAIWEKLYAVVDLRQHMTVLANLDLAVWDLAGNIRNATVCELLGGPVRERVRAYAGMLGFSTDPAAVAAASVEYVSKGFTAVKWYLPYNGSYGREGALRNVAIVRAVRDAVGPDVDIMLDWVLSNPRANSVLWAIDLARRLEEFKPTWIEEPFNFDDLDSHRRLAEATSIPIAFGEHFYNRWQIRQAIESGKPTVLQPDPMWAGGVSEMRKIITLCSTYGVIVVPHGNESCRNALNILFAQPERTCPLGEWGVKINQSSQHFYTDFYQPIDGYFPVPTGPGFGCTIDPQKVLRRQDL